MKNFNAAKLLNYFQEWGSNIINKMNVLNSTETLEWNIWTHKILMYKTFMDDVNNYLINLSGIHYNYTDNEAEKRYLMLGIIILCYDIGKIYTDKKYEYPYYSIQSTIDFIIFLMEDCDETLSNNEIMEVLTVISNHISYEKSDDICEKFLLSNNNYDTYVLSELLSFLNKKNSIDIDMNFRHCFIPNCNCNYYENVDKIIYTFNKNPSDIILLCGVPGIGKDYIAEKYKTYKILSYDDLRVEYFCLNSLEYDKKDKIKLYENAFSYCENNNVDLNELMARKINENEKYIVCNTNLSSKNRIDLIKNNFKDKNIKIVYIIAESDKIYKRNRKRNSKIISKSIINSFMHNQQIPSLNEFKNLNCNICGIELINNN